MAKVLLVEDDLAASSHLRDWLMADQYVVETADSGTFALELLQTYEYDCIILDWQLPGMSGLEVLRRLRGLGKIVPVLMLTAMSDITNKEEGFSVGADDYLTKPFDARELNARLRSLLRRAAGSPSHVLKVGNLTLEPITRIVTLDDKPIQLQPKEFALLELFMRSPNKVLSGETIVNSVWPADSEATGNTVRSYMHTLRKKIADENGKSAIQNVHGVGYKLEV
jgi:two-component system, OmpR family, response regulator